MSKDKKDPEKIDRAAESQADKILERLERIDEQFDEDDPRTLRRLDVLEDMLDIMSER